VITTRQQVNTQSSYIDASNVYGITPARLDWLRTGSVDGNSTNNGPRLLLGRAITSRGRTRAVLCRPRR
jgi:hypothetical protein